ncbi:biotin-dependent carboxyltransferase family protein [Catellatospora tritici]|uniref:5-oxoprolinase subunit C family protein n=1 Tax=Catellatospora tritici TaxID=2851566 RepID=UPI001C2CEA62|nr:biotin-dependent carboxyltransferase family protein [Catellatospora tritici]MBV1856559.1 biotin-dependent carboxyltransferase family protein [Catellatospora tritici]
MTGLVIVRPGLLTTVQDLGRRGLASLAVPPSGAADRQSLRLANRLVGNDESRAGLEATLLGVDLSCGTDRWLAVTGAPGPVFVDDRPAAQYAPVFLPAGSVLRIGPAASGLRTYVAVAGGVDVPPVLGSRSTDVMSGLGPAPLTAGTELPLGTPQGDPAPVDVAPAAAIPADPRVRLLAGPRADWFTSSLDGLTYTVTGESNRVGVRLDGPALRRTHRDELPSEGMISGAVQVPPSGLPVILLADHPTTGGYPVVGVVHPDDLWLIAQARPGTRLTFVPARRR